MSNKTITRRAVSLGALGMLAADLPACGLADERSPVSDLVDLTAREAARQIRNGSITTESYVSALLGQYRKHSDLNVAISIHEPQILERAHAIDRARARGESLGALAGIPVIVKDQIDVSGYATTAGTPALKRYVAKRNAVVIDALLQSDAIVFAKANLHELAAGGTSSNPTFGFVRNPYDPSRIPGGSSGGTAAALAARIVPLGLGEDTGGSVRIPAGFCGVCGLRPSTWPTKRYSDSGLVPPPAPDDTQTVGPMARTVSDLVLLDTVVTHSGEPALPDLPSVRLGIPQEGFWDDPDLDSRVASTVRAALETLRSSAVTLVPIDFRQILAIAASLPAGPPDGQARFAAWLSEHVPGLTLADLIGQIASADVKAYYEAAPQPGPSRTAEERRHQRAGAVEEYVRLFRSANISAIAFPNPLILAPPVAPQGDPIDLQIEVNSHRVAYRSVALRYTTFGSRLGAPGLNIPAGLAAGLPVGLELEGLPGQDRGLLALGLAVERLLKPLPRPA
jgi:indoleacetamide hydrolase